MREIQIRRRRGAEPKGKITIYPSRKAEEIYKELQHLGWDAANLLAEKAEEVLAREYEKIKGSQETA